MTCNDACSLRQRAALAIAAISLTACATVGSDRGNFGECPPVVEYSRELQARAAEELVLLPGRSAIAEMMADYAVIRERTRACGSQ